MKCWWIREYCGLPFASGRFFSFDFWPIMCATRSVCQLPEPRVTFFGGHEAYQEGKYTVWAHTLGRECVRAGMAVMTGGGPGIMAAANCGAQEAARERADGHQWTLGITVEGLDGGFKNPCAQTICLPYFFMRKWFLMYYAQAVVVFPGGIGTLDELFGLLNLIRVHKHTNVPVILLGVNYWHSLLEWYKHAVEFELIQKEYGHMLHTTDDLPGVIDHLKSRIGQ